MDIAVPLVSRRRERVLIVQKMQHVLPAFVLLGDGFDTLGRATSVGFAEVLAGAEVATSLLVIGAFFWVVRRARHGRLHEHEEAHAAHGVDWLDVLLSGMLTTEAIIHWHERGHLPRPTLLLAAVLLVIGLLHGRIAARAARRRSLRVNSSGITIGGKLFTTFVAPWSDIARIDVDDRTARIVRRDGRERRLNLRDLKGEAKVRDVLLQARAQVARE